MQIVGKYDKWDNVSRLGSEIISVEFGIDLQTPRDALQRNFIWCENLSCGRLYSLTLPANLNLRRNCFDDHMQWVYKLRMYRNKSTYFLFMRSRAYLLINFGWQFIAALCYAEVVCITLLNKWYLWKMI